MLHQPSLKVDGFPEPTSATAARIFFREDMTTVVPEPGLYRKRSGTTCGSTDADYRPARWAGFREDYRFTGKEEDIEVGLTYFGARYLNTNLRRWISPDPLTIHGGAGDSDPYAYVAGRVLAAVGPFGLDGDDRYQVVTHANGYTTIPFVMPGGDVRYEVVDPSTPEPPPPAQEPGIVAK